AGAVTMHSKGDADGVLLAAIGDELPTIGSVPKWRSAVSVTAARFLKHPSSSKPSSNHPPFKLRRGAHNLTDKCPHRIIRVVTVNDAFGSPNRTLVCPHLVENGLLQREGARQSVQPMNNKDVRLIVCDPSKSFREPRSVSGA